MAKSPNHTWVKVNLMVQTWGAKGDWRVLNAAMRNYKIIKTDQSGPLDGSSNRL